MKHGSCVIKEVLNFLSVPVIHLDNRNFCGLGGEVYLRRSFQCKANVRIHGYEIVEPGDPAKLTSVKLKGCNLVGTVTPRGHVAVVRRIVAHSCRTD